MMTTGNFAIKSSLPATRLWIFRDAGYMGGGVRIPDVQVKIILSPVARR